MADVDEIRDKLFAKISEHEELRRLYGKAPRGGKFSVKERKQLYNRIRDLRRQIRKLEAEKKMAESFRVWQVCNKRKSTGKYI